MYLHLGQDVVVPSRTIVGIFDIENTSISKITKEFLGSEEKLHHGINVSMELESSIGASSDMDREQLQKLFAEKLRENRTADIQKRSTSCGPHRDDLELKVNDLPLRLYGSQGQQRSCVLALKLAECAVIEELTGESPVILLADVMSELDSQR